MVVLLLSRALAVHSHLPEEARRASLSRVATGTIETLVALGVPGDALRETVLTSGAPDEYERLTGIHVEPA